MLLYGFRAAKRLSWRHPRPSIKCIRLAHQNMAAPINREAHPFDKARLDALLNRRFFYAPAFEIYGGMCSYRIHNAWILKPYILVY